MKKSRSWELSCAFPHLFCNMGIHSSHASGIAWKSASRNILKKPLTLKCLCFPIIFSFHFSYVLGIVGIFALCEIFKKLIILECCCFSILSVTMGIHFSHVLGVVWISTSGDRCKKPIALCFSLLLSYHGISFSTFYGNSIHFRLTLNILRNLIMCNSLWLPIFFL